MRPWCVSFGVQFLLFSCSVPCEPGDVSVIGPRYFTMEEPGPITNLLVRRGTCRDEQLVLASGRIGVVADVPQKDARLNDVGLVALALVSNAPEGESRVSILVAGHDRFFTINRARTSYAPKGIRLEFSCAPFFESQDRVFCNDQSGEKREVTELSGSLPLQRWPGVVAAAGPGSPYLYRFFDSTVAVLAGLQPHASMSFAEPVLGVSGEPDFLFVATETHLRVVDLSKGVILHETKLTDGSPQLIVSKGKRATLQVIRQIPYRKWILQYSAEGALQPNAEPFEVVWDSGVNREGLVWQCGEGLVRFIDTLGEREPSTISSLPGFCQEGLGNPQLKAGFDANTAFCPLGDPRDGRFIGVREYGLNRTICDGERVYRFDWRLTWAAKLSEIPAPE